MAVVRMWISECEWAPQPWGTIYGSLLWLLCKVITWVIAYYYVGYYYGCLLVFITQDGQGWGSTAGLRMRMGATDVGHNH